MARSFLWVTACGRPFPFRPRTRHLRRRHLPSERGCTHRQGDRIRRRHGTFGRRRQLPGARNAGTGSAWLAAVPRPIAPSSLQSSRIRCGWNHVLALAFNSQFVRNVLARTAVARFREQSHLRGGREVWTRDRRPAYRRHAQSSVKTQCGGNPRQQRVAHRAVLVPHRNGIPHGRHAHIQRRVAIHIRCIVRAQCGGRFPARRCERRPTRRLLPGDRTRIVYHGSADHRPIGAVC